MGLNEDMPWVDLTQEEVNELRAKKHELTEYGKQRLKQMTDQFAGNYEGPLYAPHPDLMTPYPDEMFEEAERRERANRILERYNHFYNIECSSLSYGTPITPEYQQAMTLECMLDALRCENLNHEFDSIPTDDINDLIDNLYEQGRNYLERVKND
jgi:hypothetical protein